jgi:RND family efflux transporter MFP subunit
MFSFRLKSKARNLAWLVLPVVLLGCQPSEKQAQEPVIRPVMAQRIELSANQQSSYPATAEATERASLGFRVGGKILRIAVHAGEPVVAGQLLAELDPRIYQLRVDAAAAQAMLAEVEYKRGQRLLKERTISQASFDELQANLKVTQAELSKAQQDLSYTQLIAPFDGTISLKSRNAFEMVAPNQPILNLQAQGLIDITLSLAESRFRAQGDIAKLTAKVRFDSYPEESFDAVFKSLDAEVSADTGSYRLRFTLPSPDVFQALPGMTALVSLIESDKPAPRQSVELPKTAICGSATGQKSVWLIAPSTMQVKRQHVTLDMNGRVIEGLSNNDLVVLRGVNSLKEGQKVRLWRQERGI